MGYKVPPTQRPPQKPGTNRKLILNAMQAWKRPRVDIRDPQAIAERIEEYLTHCAEEDAAPSVGGCTNWLGVSINTLRHWYEGSSGSAEHQKVATMFYAVLQDIWAQDMHDGNINPVSGIFVGKAFYGYKDTQEIVIQQNANQDALSTADLIAESKRLPGAERFLTADNSSAIDADIKIIDDPALERAEAREKRKAERKEAAEANKPIRKAKKKEYLKEYYQEHKEEYQERRRKYNERKKAAELAEKDKSDTPTNES